MRLWLVLGAVQVGTAGTAAPVGAQLLFDWPVRSAVEPEPLLTGGAAAAWNPAGLAPAAGGVEQVWIVNLDGPTETGLGGVVAAASWIAPALGPVGVSYRHLGISGIALTSTTPKPEPGDLSLGEDAATVSLAFDVAERAGVGVAVRYARSSGGPQTLQELSLDLGGLLRLSHALRPRIGVLARGLGASTSHVMSAVGVTAPRRYTGPFQADLAYGIDVATDRKATEHRLSLLGTWRGDYHVGVGANRNGEDGWTGMWTASADLGRYSLGVLRENLANGFGAATYYRLAIRLR